MSVLPFITNFKMVILKNPSKIWSQTEDAEFRNLFYKIARLKLRGYEAEYPPGVLPIDTTDFIATHILICDMKPEGASPITGIKSTTLSQSQTHRLNFPALSLVQAAEAQPHIQAMIHLIQQCQKLNKELAYTGSWTINPETRKDRVLTKEVTRMFYAAYVLYHMEYQINEIITGGTMRFKADHFFRSMGHDIFSYKGQPLPPIYVKHLFGEQVQLLHLKAFTEEAKRSAEEFREMWSNRLEIDIQSIIKRHTFKNIA